MASTCVVPVWCPGGGRIGHWGKPWSRRSGRSGGVLDSPLCQLAQFPSSSAGGGTGDWCCWTNHDHSTCTDWIQAKCLCCFFIIITIAFFFYCMFNNKCTTIRMKSLTELPFCFSEAALKLMWIKPDDHVLQHNLRTVQWESWASIECNSVFAQVFTSLEPYTTCKWNNIPPRPRCCIKTTPDYKTEHDNTD